MNSWRNAASLLALIIPATAYAIDQATAASCDDLMNIKLPNVTIISATSVSADAFVPPEGIMTSLRKVGNHIPAFCRITGAIKPVPDSDIGFEVWMPASGWNGKFLSVGEGGEGGYIYYPGMAEAMRRGYATASTDTGHSLQMQEKNFQAFFSKHFVFQWAVGHPERVKDYGYRAKHLQTVVAKAIVEAFYRTAPKHSYFNGCSNGGRQGLMEAQRYPADYDGIVVGAPDIFWDHALVLGIWNEQALVESPGSRIPPSKLPAIQAAALDACEEKGVAIDGLVESPQKCGFDPAKLLCKTTDSNTCLTAPQVTALRKIIDGARASTGAQIYPGFIPEYAAAYDNWEAWITGSPKGEGLLFQAGDGFFGNYVFHDANWDFRKFNFDRDVSATDKVLGPDLFAGDPDLTAFKAHGGKIIIYQGWADQMVVPGVTVGYYQEVMKKMGKRTTQEFARLFMVPGMMHCFGGAGPDSIGQESDGPPQLFRDSEHDVVAALDKWVEQGVAPKSIIATKYANEEPNARVLRTHLLCPFPQIAVYKGREPTDDAESYVCAESARITAH